jgi:hypothetical protein
MSYIKIFFLNVKDTIKYLFTFTENVLKNLTWASVTLVIILLYGNSINNFLTNSYQMTLELLSKNKLELILELKNEQLNLKINRIIYNNEKLEEQLTSKHKKIWKELDNTQKFIFIKIALENKEDYRDLKKLSEVYNINDLFVLNNKNLINLIDNDDKVCSTGNYMQEKIQEYLKNYNPTKYIIFPNTNIKLQVKVILTKEGEKLYNEIYKLLDKDGINNLLLQ